MSAHKKRAKADSEARTYGAALALIVGVAAVFFYAFAHPSPGAHYDIKAIVTSSNQLRTGSPVRIAGIDVGVVRAMDRGPGHTTKLTLRINANGQPLHTDASLKIRPRLFLEGGYYVDMKPGSASTAKLNSGGTIALSNTAVPVQLNDILSELSSPPRASFKRVIKEVDDAIGHGGAQSFRRTMPNLGPALKDLAWVAKAARGTQPHDVSQLIHDGAKLTSALSQRRSDLAGLVSNLDQTAQALNSGDGALGRTIDALDRVLRAAPPALAGLDASLPTLVRFARTLSPALPGAPAQLRDINAGLAELAKLVAPAERKRVVNALTVTFENLPTLVNRLAALFPVTRSTLDCLGTHVVPTFNEVVNDGALSTGQPVWQELIHGLVGFSSISQNFDANGYITRFAPSLTSSGLSLEKIPLLGNVLTNTAPVQSRPVWLGSGISPPFHPEAPCASQALAPAESKTAGPTTQPVTRSKPQPLAISRLERALSPKNASKLRRELAAR
jgi:phospholipid/cholesterol/gamma-HCH transport system substrate-binding protein